MVKNIIFFILLALTAGASGALIKIAIGGIMDNFAKKNYKKGCIFVGAFIIGIAIFGACIWTATMIDF